MISRQLLFFHSDPQHFFFSSLGCVKPFGTSPIQSLVLSYEDMHTTYSYTKTHTNTNTLVLSLSLEWLWLQWITMVLSIYKQTTFLKIYMKEFLRWNQNNQCTETALPLIGFLRGCLKLLRVIHTEEDKYNYTVLIITQL